jgi:glucokinase
MYLGIEIGGTKLQLGLGQGDGTLVGLWRGAVDLQAGPQGIRDQILAAVPELLGRAGMQRTALQGVGLGFGGPVDDATHTIIKSHQIDGWDNFPLARWIEEMLGVRAALGNDSDVAGLAEALFGAGKGVSPLFYMNVGSGIGGALILDGEIYRGCGRGAAEVGHLKSRHEEASLQGSPAETVEDVASGWAIARRAQEEAASDLNSPLYRLVDGQLDRITPAHVAQAALEGDSRAEQLLQSTWWNLAQALCHVIVLLCPRRVVIGGGVSLLGEKLMFEPLRRLVDKRVFRPFSGCYEIVPAALGEEVVVQGALALARKRFGN